MTNEEAKAIIEKLVNRFAEQRNGYHATDYNETKTRRDFIDPFFTALGWDMDNSQDVAEPYREVIHEDKVKIQGKTKAPDYGFRLQGAKDRLFLIYTVPDQLINEWQHWAFPFSCFETYKSEKKCN